MRQSALKTGRWIACGTLVVLFPLVGARPEACGSEPHRTVRLENARLCIGVGRTDGRLIELTDRAARRNCVGDSSELVPLWEIDLRAEDTRLTLRPGEAGSFRCSLAEDGSRGRLVWSDFTSPPAGDCRVEVTVELDSEAPSSRWTMAVSKPAGTAIRQIRFPRVAGIRRAAREHLAVPLWMGQLLAEPRSALRGKPGRPGRMAWSYPGRMSMQCVAFYSHNGAGFYAACDDTAARRKGFAFWGSQQEDVHFETWHEPIAGAVGADHYALPYGVVLGAFRGDWFTAAERYRSWATSQPWALNSRLARGAVPAWVRDTSVWVWNRGRSPGVLKPAAALQQHLGLPVSVFWHWWHGCPYDIGFPEYFPPREGTESFQRAVAEAHENGLHMLIYMNQRAWGLSTRSWKEQGAERYAVKGPDGKIRPEIYNIFTRQALVPMCLGTPFWRNTYAGLAERAVQELGVDGIYMDQACSQLPCYDPQHEHPPGGGTSWIDGFRMLVEDIRRRCDAQRNVVLAGEGCGEAWMPQLDLMLALQVSRERYAGASDPWEPIPFFQAVYHPSAITYGSYSSLVEPPYDELWPAEHAPGEPLRLLDRKHAPQFYLEQARTFVWGQQLCLANFLPSQLQQRAEEIDYLVRLARVRARARKYLLYGEMLRPPAGQPPKTTSEFSRLSIYAGQKDRVTTYSRRHPLALAGAWRAADGDVAVALASIADVPLPVSFPVDRKAYRLPPRFHVHCIDESGSRVLQLDDQPTPTVRMTLPPRGVCVLEFTTD